MKRKTIKRIRRIYLFSSILMGVLAPLICLYFFPEFDPRIHPVSLFGILKESALIFTILLIIFSIALLWNGMTAIRKLIKHKKYQFWLRLFLAAASFNLCLTGIIHMTLGPLHQIPALCFFLAYNFFIFLFGIGRTKSYVRQGLFSSIIGSLMLLSSLLLIPFPSYGVAEIWYIFLIFFWNIIMWLHQQKLIRM
ncbi:MAG: hypothetical protein CMP56_04460 [Flavobacteriales bacterium]|nr:hypothetical protein [Flavobacteriales bacterium]